MPHACIGVDVIVGFPGETNEDFQETFDFLHGLDVSYFHVFTYSERINTPAIQLPGAVPMSVRRDRNEILRQLGEKKKHHFYHSHLNTCRSVLVEHDSALSDQGESQWCGFTDNYIRVHLNKKMAEPNHVIPLKLDRFNSFGEIQGV